MSEKMNVDEVLGKLEIMFLNLICKHGLTELKELKKSLSVFRDMQKENEELGKNLKEEKSYSGELIKAGLSVREEYRKLQEELTELKKEKEKKHDGWYCENCGKELQPREVTYMETCVHCGSAVS